MAGRKPALGQGEFGLGRAEESIRPSAKDRWLRPEQHAEIEARFLAGEGVTALAREYGITVQAISQRFKRRGMPNLVRERREARDALISAMYASGKSLEQIGIELGWNSTGAMNSLERQGVPRRKGRESMTSLQLDEAAFDEITEESAYWVGFLMADGCVNDTQGQGRVSLSLAVRDVAHVRKFREFMKCSNKISYSKPTITHHKGKPSIGTGSYSFTFMSSKVGVALAKFGITPRKSHTAKVEHLEDDRHFWRGVVDGDGSLYWSDGKPNITLIGSFDLVSQFRVRSLVGSEVCRQSRQASRGLEFCDPRPARGACDSRVVSRPRDLP